MKTIASSLLLLLPFPVGIAAEKPEGLTALEIMTRADERYTGDSATSNNTLILIDRKGRERIRNLKTFRKEYSEGSKTLMFFESPADIEGTAFLSFEWNGDEREDDSWLYLPALQQVKRIASSDESASFLGSDFSFVDINGLELRWYDFRIATDSELVDGHDCWVIEAIPKPEFKQEAERSTGYSQTRTWVRKDNFVAVRGMIWVIEGKRVKYFSASDVVEIDGVWTPKRIQMVTTKQDEREHSSVLRIDDVSYNGALGDEVFATENMVRGLN